MRQPRIKVPSHHPVAYYHCISRVVNREFIFGDLEKAMFVKFMRSYERFCGVRVVTFCVMSNHFHILVEVPRRPEQLPDDEALLELIATLGGESSAGTVRQILQRLRAEGSEGSIAAAEALRESYFSRMWDVSMFMKSLKQRFTVCHNRQHSRKGTLWEERYKSVLVEGSGDALATMAAYIDLNPLRAGMVTDPKAYRFCGYGEAVAGEATALAGLAVIARYLSNASEVATNLVLAEYREWIYGQGEERGVDESGAPVRRRFSQEAVQEVIAAKGQLTRQELIRCKVRYFVDGCVIGSKAFVDEIFHGNRERFGASRQDGGRKMRSTTPALFSMRNLAANVYA